MGRGGSPTAVQAWQPCPLWEPSPSHPILLYTRGLAVLYLYAVFVYFLCVYACEFCVLFVLCVVFLCSFLQYFDTVGWVF